MVQLVINERCSSISQFQLKDRGGTELTFLDVGKVKGGISHPNPKDGMAKWQLPNCQLSVTHAPSKRVLLGPGNAASDWPAAVVLYVVCNSRAKGAKFKQRLVSDAILWCKMSIKAYCEC